MSVTVTMRDKLRLQRQQEEADSEEESEYETDSVFETDSEVLSLVFVPKSERDLTIAEQELAQEEAVRRRRMEERKVETKQIVVEKIREEQEMMIQKNMEAEQANTADVETDDELNEHERWKAREIGKIKRDREVRDQKKNPNSAAAWTAGKRKQRRFMQKYYHKGAFFQSGADDQASSGIAAADAIYSRDFSSPTGEDKMDKIMLPKVMQVKQFGRSKYTHLCSLSKFLH